jgi:PAS domain S-box-containing protein
MDLSGELAKTLLELAPDATVIVDSSGKIVFANAQIEQTFGYAPTDLVGQPVEKLLPERFRPAHGQHRTRFAMHPKQRPMGHGLALFGLHRNGQEFPVEISLSPVKSERGMLVVSAIRDASDRQARESELVEANRAKSRLLAAASHDLRQPLTTLNLLNRVAAREAGENTNLRGVLDRQQRALDSMSELLASVLDISKLDSGAVIAKPVVCALDGIFDRLRSDFEPQAAEKGLALVVERTAEASVTDPELLRRLLSNLLSNAIRYTPRGRVHIACTPRGSELVIEVSDTGLGIPASELERIFEEFYQVDRGTQRPEGLGLGLSIVRRIAALLRASVTVQSNPGEGTTFRVAVPRGRLEVAAVEPAAPTAGRQGGRILVVDDEPAVAEATGLLLEVEGFEVRVVSCEREALDQLDGYTPDVVISDYHLRHGETGLTVVNAVRQRLQAAIPVIFMTGDTAQSPLAHSRIENARLVSKPIRADELLATVQAQLAASAQGD